MDTPSHKPNPVSTVRHRGPHLGALAIVYAVLFNAGLYPVTIFADKIHFPGPWEKGDVIVSYFQTHPSPVLICLFLQFGALVPLGIFTASVVSRLHFLGVRAAGPYIALFGGFAVVFNGMAASFSSLGHGSSWHRPGSHAAARVVLPLLRLRRSRLLRAHGSAVGPGVCPGCIPEAATQLGCGTRPGAGGLRRTELAEPDCAEGLVPDSAGSIPKFRLADCDRIPAAESCYSPAADIGGAGMKIVAGWFMIANAALFFFGAVQHAGIAVGSFHEPLIIPAAIVETLCGLCLLWGAGALFRNSKTGRRTALIMNFVALAGVLLGIAALAAGAGPRTASNDLYHRIMLLLIGASLLILFLGRSRLNQRRPSS